jgi:hypothetical protein
MSTIETLTTTFNGVIDTTQPVMRNLETMCTAAKCWLTFDINTGKWSVVINRSGGSIASFNDSNIIGGINVSGTGLTELYNKVRVEFPHKDLNDEKDWLSIAIPVANRFNNEHENTLEMSFDIINDPIWAEMIASTELKQSRVDKIIEFRTDYSKLGLKAGDLIDVTAEMYGYTNKVFRIVTIAEEDADDGTIQLSITALEYDADVYDYSDLALYQRERANGIKPATTNFAVKSSDNYADVPLDLSNIAKALGLLLVFNSVTGRWELSQGGQQATIAGDSAIIEWVFNPEYNEQNIGGTSYQIGFDDGGRDLDIRCRVAFPDIGQDTLDEFLGWTGDPVATNSTSVWPPTGTPILIWGGDNTGTGKEQVYVNIERLKELFPTQQYFVVECRGNWYGTPGSRPVSVAATMYEGGTVTANPATFTFTVTGYTKVRYITGVSTFINSNFTGEAGAAAPGDLIGYFIFDAFNDLGQFRNTLTGI